MVIKNENTPPKQRTPMTAIQGNYNDIRYIFLLHGPVV